MSRNIRKCAGPDGRCRDPADIPLQLFLALFQTSSDIGRQNSLGDDSVEERESGTDFLRKAVAVIAAYRALLDDGCFFPDSDFLQLEVSRPFTLNAACTATPRDLPRYGRKMRQKVMEMHALLEMIPPAVWNDSRVDDMKLADAPSVEPRLGEQLLEHPVVAHLDIPAAHAQASHIASGRESAGIAVMQHPAKARSLAVDSLDIEQLNFGEGVEYVPPRFQGPRDAAGKPFPPRLGYAGRRGGPGGRDDSGSCPERKIVAERHGRNLGKIAVDCCGAQELIVAMPDDAAHLNFEEPLGNVNRGNTTQFHDLAQRPRARS